jgi:N,N-dimethylformamidase
MTDQTAPAVPPLTGYLDRLSARPGERIAVKTSSRVPGQIAARVVRIWNADANPEGVGLHIEDVAGLDLGTFAAQEQPARLGSWGWVPTAGLFDTARLVVSLRVQPWLVRESGGTILALTGPDGASLWTLTAYPDRIEAVAGDAVIAAAITPKRKVWYHLTLALDLRGGAAELSVASLDGYREAASGGAFSFAPVDGARLSFAARPEGSDATAHFNGRLEDITFREQGPEGPVRAFWDFSIAMNSAGVVDTGPLALHGQLVNLPTRAVRGSHWDGTEMVYTHAPRQYAAIHFHEDDIYDCGWDTSLELAIPEGLASGIYGVKLTQDGHEDIIPFFVLPPKGTRNAKVCYLASTFTYIAYCNHARGNLDDAMEARITDWGTPRGPDNYPGFGTSTYNYHPDGAGHCFSSRLRPMLTMRPGFQTFAIHEGSGLRHFPADGHLVEWFRRMEIDIDVITDEDLHREGLELIAGYDALVTGSHPEYHTPETLNALRDYTRQGGNFCYLGGNGFYWKIAVSDALPGVIEVRRAEGGIRAWATEAGEGYHMLDGQYGGLWRRNGRAPQEIGAVGFSGQGFFEGSPYALTPEAADADVAWIFEGLDEDPLGDYGFSGGGAAGFELDRVDFALGTPEGTKVLARSFGHGPSFMCVPEEVLSHFATLTGEPPKDLVRAEIAYARLPGGGQIFTTGSITFCGSLPWNDFDNGCSRMLENVVRRFGGLEA